MRDHCLIPRILGVHELQRSYGAWEYLSVMSSLTQELLLTTWSKHLPPTRNGPTWSIRTRAQGRAGHSQGCSGAAAGDLRLTWHWWHSLTISSMSASISGHHTMPQARAFIVHTPGWPWCSSFNTVSHPDCHYTAPKNTTTFLTQFILPLVEWMQLLITGVVPAVEHHLLYGW